MKIENFRRLIKEDVDQQYRPLVEKIGYILNPFAEQIVQAFNKNLSIDDNLNWSKKTITVTVDSNGTPTSTTQFQSGIAANTVYGITVEKAINLTNPNIYPTGAPFISYSENNKLITINNIKGLPSGNNFQLNLIIKS